MEQSELAIQLFRLGAFLPVAMGAGHALLALLDTVTPRFFTPRDDQVRLAMTRTTLGLTRRMSVWRAWLGFNLSHSLGLVSFGLALLLISFTNPELLLGSTPLAFLAITASLAYFVLAIRFWFYAVAIGAALSFLCLALSRFLAHG